MDRIRSDPELFGYVGFASDRFDKKVCNIFANLFKMIHFFFDYILIKENLQKALKSCRHSTFKICQLFSWPGLKDMIRIQNDLKSRIRIRTKSFRIPITGRKENSFVWF